MRQTISTCYCAFFVEYFTNSNKISPCDSGSSKSEVTRSMLLSLRLGSPWMLLQSTGTHPTSSPYQPCQLCWAPFLCRFSHVFKHEIFHAMRLSTFHLFQSFTSIVSTIFAQFKILPRGQSSRPVLDLAVPPSALTTSR